MGKDTTYFLDKQEFTKKKIKYPRWSAFALSCFFLEEKIQESHNFHYTGSIEEFVAPIDGKYKMECWGAQGGWAGDGSPFIQGGKGGYSHGILEITEKIPVYIVVGGKGEAGKTHYGVKGGYNGGGNSNYWVTTYNGGGGGATHVAYETGLLATIDKSKVIIVAGGGGGSASNSTRGGTSLGGYGGGLNGGNGATSPNNDGYIGLGGTKNGGGKSTAAVSNWNGTSPGNGDFGIDGNASTGGGGAGGGAGFYGGGGASVWCGAGGCGYVNTDILDDAQTIAGNEIFLSPLGIDETGHEGNGECIITQIF